MVDSGELLATHGTVFAPEEGAPLHAAAVSPAPELLGGAGTLLALDQHPAKLGKHADRDFPISMRRLGIVMERIVSDANEVCGVLNPAAARGRDGQLYLFPRMVADGNVSRIGIARVLFDGEGNPVGVERLGIALEPEADYERRGDGGGCENPRISFVESLGCYVMTYVAFGPDGPRIALARSDDLLSWRRVGLAAFAIEDELRFAGVDDKDFLIFPASVQDPAGNPAIAVLHRPRVECMPGAETAGAPAIWISYCTLAANGKPHDLCTFTAHHRLAVPEQAWEQIKIGGGTPPVLTPFGWLLLYHGISSPNLLGKSCYSAGLMLLDAQDPRKVRYRSPTPVMVPETPAELSGTVADVVFPTGIDQRGGPDGLQFDVYYGMADTRIGVARLDLSKLIPPKSTQGQGATISHPTR